MNRDPRHLRRTALLLLVAWLFALATGFAHGCGVTAALARGDAPVSAHCEHAGDAAAAHDGGAPAQPSACAKFCADGAKARASADLLAADLIGLPAQHIVGWPVTAVGPVRDADAARSSPPRAGVPIAIALLRLTR